jgi:hypothetical protein
MVDRNNETPQQPQTQPTEVIGDVGHSGNLPGRQKELPVYDFPLTLAQAVRADAVQTTPPDTLADHVDPTKSTPTDRYAPLLPDQPPLYEQPLSPPAPEKKPRSKKKGVAAMAAGAVASAVIGGLGAVQMFGGGDTTEPRNDPSTSAPENPNSQPTAEVTDPTKGLDILSSSGTGAEVQAEFSTIVSGIVNRREDAGNVATDNADLQYLTNTAPGVSSPGLIELQDTVKQWTSDLEVFRKLLTDNKELYEQENGYTIVDPQKATFELSSEIQTTKIDEFGGLTVETIDNHFAVFEVQYPDGRKEMVKGTVDGTSNRRYTYNSSDVSLPGDKVKNTLVLVSLENLPDDAPAQ